MAAHLHRVMRTHQTLLERIPVQQDVQSAWTWLLHSASSRTHYHLRVVRPEWTEQSTAGHNDRIWRCLCRRTRQAAYWASWADLPLHGEAPAIPSADLDPSEWRTGWPHEAASRVEENHRERFIFPRADERERTLLGSQSGLLAGVPFATVPRNYPTCLESQLFRVLLLRLCRCDRQGDSFGHHRAACAQAGFLARQGVAVEIAAAKVCREAGARFPSKIMMTIYRNSQIAVGWMEKYWRYLDSIASVDISHTATWSARSRYENNLTLGVNDGEKPRPTTRRDDFPRAFRTVGAIKDEEGRMNPYIPEHLRERQRRLDEKLRSDLEWQSWNWNVNWSQASSSSSTDRWQSAKWHEPQQREMQDQQWWQER